MPLPRAEPHRLASWTLDYDPPAASSPIRTGCHSRENTIDLSCMPHALEFTDDPHQMLREV